MPFTPPTGMNAVLRRMLTLGPQGNYTTSGSWVTATANGGGTDLRVGRNVLSTNTTANASALAYINGLGLSVGDADAINWDKRVLVAVVYRRNTSESETVAYVQLKTATTHGALGAVGVGLTVNNLTLVGTAYGTELGTTATLATLTTADAVLVVIDHDPARAVVDFWLKSAVATAATKAATISTAAQIPTGQTANIIFMHSVANGASGGTNAISILGPIEIVQEQ